MRSIDFQKIKWPFLVLYQSVILITVTILSPVIAPYPFEKQDYTAIGEGPSLKHPMGTDFFGRDMLSRILYGGLVSISIGLLVQASLL